MQSSQTSRGEIEPDRWNEFLADFSKRNENKLTRLEVVGLDVGAQILEKCLPLVGVNFEPKGSEAGSVEIILGGDSAEGPRQMEHLVLKTKRIMPLTGSQSLEDGLGFEGEDGTRTLLIFEGLRELPPA